MSEQRSSSARASSRRRILSPGRRELIRANDARDRRDWNTAASEYQRHLRIRPNNFSIWVQLGHALKESGQPAQALAAYGEALRIDPRNADLLLNLGHLYKIMGLPGGAEDFYRRSLAVDGNQRAADELARLSPGAAQGFPRPVSAAAIIGAPAAPAAQTPSGLKASSTHWIDRLSRIRAKTARQRGDAARDVRDWPSAAIAYRDYLGIRPDHAAIWVQYGHALKEAGRLDDALDAYQEALRIHGDHADLMLSIGHVYKLRGDLQSAATCYEMSTRQDNNPVAFDELRRLSASAAMALSPLARPERPAALNAPSATQVQRPAAASITHPAPEPAKPPVALNDLSFETLSTAEALIDRTGRPRLLLDAADEIQSTGLVDAFLAVDGLDVEVWCLFAGQLKAWMRPDMLLEDIPSAEYGLYFASVDIVLMTHVDAGFNARVFAYLACGAIPLGTTAETHAALAASGVIAGVLQPQESPLRDQVAVMTADPAKLLELRQAAKVAAPAFKAAAVG